MQHQIQICYLKALALVLLRNAAGGDSSPLNSSCNLAGRVVSFLSYQARALAVPKEAPLIMLVPKEAPLVMLVGAGVCAC